METALSIVASNNPLLIVALIAVLLCYAIIGYIAWQRSNTAKVRNEQNDARAAEIQQLQKEKDELKNDVKDMKEQLNKMETDKQLIQKDVAHLIEETSGIKEDIREIKVTLGGIQLSLEKIGAYYDFLKEKRTR